MSDQPSEISPYLRRPLYVFDLPKEILDTLSVRARDDASQQVHTVDDEIKQTSSTSPNDDGVSTSTSCTLCRATFKDVNEQRQHVRSDFHRYNLKLAVKHIPPIDESTFIEQIGDLDESISGSDTSSSEDEDQGVHAADSTLTALLKKQARLAEQEEDSFGVSKRRRGAGSAPIKWLSTPKIGPDIGLGVYRAILSNAEQEEAPLHLIDTIRRRQIKPIRAKPSGQTHSNSSSQDPHFFLCMIGGGHFAAAVISLAPELRKGPGGVEERHAVVKAHKTFHRYTTRRKQGGSQSANDNAKGNAHSAGSSVRRYNEAALEADVRNVLSDWKSLIDSAELLFIRATGTTNRRTLFGPYDGQILRTNDPRIRGFPFSTRRATQGELIRSFQQLTRLQVSTVIKEEDDAEKAKQVSASPKPQKPKTPATATPQRSKEEEFAILHTSQLQTLVRRTKAPGLLLYLTKNELSPNFEFFPPSDNYHSPTPLHLAASTNSPSLVTALLTKAKADPTLQNREGKTAYQIAGDARTRDAFRTSRHTLGETAWDWDAAAHVPSALSSDEVQAREQREREIADKAEASRRQADLEKIRTEEEKRAVNQIERKAGAGRTLGAAPVVAVEKTGAERREEDARGMTPEMRQRLERERRARAAEARIKAMSGR